MTSRSEESAASLWLASRSRSTWTCRAADPSEHLSRSPTPRRVRPGLLHGEITPGQPQSSEPSDDVEWLAAPSARLCAEERDELSGHALPVVDKRPVAALGQDHHLRAREESRLDVGESHGDVGACAPQMTIVGGFAARSARLARSVTDPRSGVAR